MLHMTSVVQIGMDSQGGRDPYGWQSVLECVWKGRLLIRTEGSTEASLAGESEALLSSPGIPIYELLPGMDAHPGHLLVHSLIPR